MKKLFLIPLMAMLCTVMAWATDVANKTELQNALNAGGNITLTANINLGASHVTMTSGTVVLDLNGYKLTSSITGDNGNGGEGTLVVSGGQLTINDATGNGEIGSTGSKYPSSVAVTNGAKLIVNGGKFSSTNGEGIGVRDAEAIINGGTFPTPGDNNILIWHENANVTINGGTFSGSTGWRCFQIISGANVLINNINVVSPGGGVFYDGGATIEIRGGSFKTEDPTKYVNFDVALMTYDSENDIYTVSTEVSGGAYSFGKIAAYATLQAAVDATEAGDHILVLENGQSVTVNKSLTFDLNGKSATITAGSGLTKYVNGDFVTVTTAGNLCAYLNGDTETPMVISSNVALKDMGLVRVKGNKKITINEGVTVNTAYLLRYPSIVVPNGAKLTIEGDGTIAGTRTPIYVEKGGELIIGKADKSDQLKITTSVAKPTNSAIINYGKTTINNSEIHAKSGAASTFGNMEILGGLYTSEAYSPNHIYCIKAGSEGQLTLKNSTVKGAHGALCVEGLDLSKKAGNARVEDCELIATNNPNGNVLSTTAIHYGIYCATGGVVSVYNTKMKSTQQDKAVQIGNNDAYNTFGLVYLYEGCMVKAPSGKRIWVQKRTATDKDVLFPVSVDESSAWYTAAMNGGEGPLPAGYAWKAIIAEGEPTENQVLDAAAYADGYRWITVSTATETQEADVNSTTIPWQQSSTWDASASSTSTADVPEATTAVTIPEGKTVVISNDPTKNNGIADAVAEQVVLGGEDAKLIVEEGTSLNVTNGVNIADGAKLVIDAGAKVIVGEGGVVTANEEAIEIKASEQKYGVFMIAPTVTENTHPMATVQLTSKAYKKADGTYVWQRFGVPSYMEGVTRGDIVYDHVAAPTSVLKLDYENHTWASMDYEDTFEPFRCYELTTTATTPGAVYTFNCPLMGNGNAELVIEGDWNYYANSYSAPIDIKTLLQNYKENVTSVSATIQLYRASDNWWLPINLFAIEENDIPDSMKVIRPMQAFIFQRWQGGTNPSINYANEVYNPIVNPASAPRRTVQNTTKVTINLTDANGHNDWVRLVEGTNFSDDFDNGYDAVKYKNGSEFNIYAPTMDGDMVYLATDNLNGQLLSMNTKEETSFTMTFSGVRGETYYIKDMLTNTITAMQEGNTYCFNTLDNATIEGRFQIIGRQELPTEVETIENAKTGATSVYTIAGQYVGEIDNWNNLPAGIYIVDGVKMVK